MARKLGAPIALGVVTVIAILLLTGNHNQNEDVLKSTFSLQAVYYNDTQNSDSGYIQITFKDNTEKTNSVVLEVLGMDKSFQKTFFKSEFVEDIPFSGPPKYGWKIHPVTLLIDHQDLGTVSLKTEIRPDGEPPAPIIYGNP